MLKEALEQLKILTGIGSRMEDTPGFWLNDTQKYVIIKLEDDNEIRLMIESRAEIRSITKFSPLYKLAAGLNPNEGFLFVANYIEPKQKILLRERNCNYLEVSGNCYIRHGSVFIFIEGQKISAHRTKVTGKAFKSTGLKVILALLVLPDLITEPYRDIADASDVSLGSIGGILDDLDVKGFVKLNSGKKSLNNTEKLLDAWVERYQVLKTKFSRGQFSLLNKTLDTKDIPLEDRYIITGLENHQTQITESSTCTIYSDMKGLETSLVQNNSGRIEMIRPFWGTRIAQTSNNSLEAILRYADYSIGASSISVNLDMQKTLKERINSLKSY